ncbi:hypothetical protein [Paenibacillus qinlingensis]|uniref:Uncharacterized protein n=1 Tax=Paenibacillus qinlingensis TaxID=1837343 RepID=A0ABU1P3R6_9BACL|nr:hypothetical protein [Paenibacillus qinlingensis]MDR6554348.1 hypothetical protein [Paenibacillus qinlingensis]
MWLKLTALTISTILLTLQQMSYWSKKGGRKQAYLFLIWMIIAWGIGCAFIGGFHLPEPTKPLFPGWE